MYLDSYVLTLLLCGGFGVHCVWWLVTVSGGFIVVLSVVRFGRERSTPAGWLF